MDGLVDVRTMVTTAQYRRLHQIAKANGTTVGALIGELTRRALTPRAMGRRAKYTPELGQRILTARLFNRSWSEISRDEGIAYDTAQSYARRAQQAKEQAHV